MGQNAIKDLRIKNGLSQDDLASMLYVSRDLVSKWETGKRRPSNEMVSAIAAIFDVSAEFIEPTDKKIFDELSLCIPSGTLLNENQIHILLNSFLGTLSDRDRNIFICRYYHLNSISILSNTFDITKNNARVVLHRIRMKLKKYLEEELK